MDLSCKPPSQNNAVFPDLEQEPVSETISGYCDATYTPLVSRADRRPCSLDAKQVCANCEAKLCDLHAQFCAICLSFFCEGCLDLHNQEGQHADGSIGEIVAIVREGVQR
jgi:hypothetical protein